MDDQGKGVDPDKAIANITKGPDKKEDLMLLMTANGDWDQFFFPAPMSIALLGELLLVSADRDISLRDRCPIGGFEYLKYPDSLRACLVQITNSGWNAFNMAHTNMDQIRLHTSNVETHIKYAVRILLKGTTKEIEKTLPLALSKVSEIADTCKDLANESEKNFMEVMNLTKETIEACSAAQGHYQKKDRDTEIAIRVASQQKKQSEELKKEIDENYQKMEREWITAKEKLDSAVKEMPSASQLIGAYMLGGIVDTFRNSISPISAQFSMKVVRMTKSALGKAQQPMQTVNISIWRINDGILFIKSMHQLFELEGGRPNINEVEKGSALEIRKQLEKEKEKIDDDSSALHIDFGNCIDKAIKVCSDLIDYASRAEHDNVKAGEINKLYDELLNDVWKIEIMLKKNHAYPFESSASRPKRTNSSTLVGSISDQARFKVETAKQNLAEAKKKYEETYKESRKESERLKQTLVEMQKLDFTKIEFDEILKFLKKGIQAMADVREQWGKLCGIFQMISNLIKCCLHSSLKNFVDYSSAGMELVLDVGSARDIFKQNIIEQATEANRVAYVVQSISSAYVEISSNYLMDGISSLGKLLPLDRKENLEEMKQMRAKLHEDMEKARKAILDIMEKNKREFDRRVAERVKRIETEVEDNLPPIPEERIKEIRASLQDAFITDSAEIEEALGDHF